MKVPYTWLKDYVAIDLPLDELARVMTNAGLEVESLTLVGLPYPQTDQHDVRIDGLSWEPDKIVVAQINEVMPHPNADRLVLCRLDDGGGEQTILTGAPNLYEYKETGRLPQPIKVAYAREGARIYDGHQPGTVLTTLKRTRIRGVESFSMVCSEKELGISDEDEGIIMLDPGAPTGMALVDYMGDAVFDIKLQPNVVRCASMVGVAREIAAFTGKPLRKPQAALPKGTPSIEGKAAIHITDPKLNPRFVLGLIEGVRAQPSPYEIQRRMRLAGMRPINSVVDATNYVMLELGEPLHAFDYDVLRRRVDGDLPTIITRAAQPGETLQTLDEVDRQLDDFTILVCDKAGPLSLAGVMGGMESEVTESTRTVLLEGAAWNFINTRRTMASQRLNSEAGYRFARGVHPALAPEGVELCLQRMAEWSGGTVYSGLVDAYPVPVQDPVVTVTPADVRRLLGIELTPVEMAALLTRLEFSCQVEGDAVVAATPPHRLDIGSGVSGKADLVEEIARMVGYENIPSTHLGDPLPALHPTPVLNLERRVRSLLVRLGLQEVVNYRLTSPEREARLSPQPALEELPYLHLRNPLTPERGVMRRSLLASVMESLEKNARLRDRLALFEIGPVFLPTPAGGPPEEQLQLAIAVSGQRDIPAWDKPASALYDFYDLKGILEGMLEGLGIPDLHFTPTQSPSYHPGKCAEILSTETRLGIFGELHPLVKEQFDLLTPPVLAVEIDFSALLACVPPRVETAAVPVYPPVLEDLAVVVREEVPADSVEAAIRQGGGKLLTAVRLFDIYRGSQIGEGMKSLAFSLTYQAPDRTLSANESAQIRARIIKRLEQLVGGKLRS